MTISVKFLGAAGTVTGSKYLIDTGQNRLLVDAGMFQGQRVWRERNWDQPDVKLSTIDAVLLTHAHIDHTGILPRYHRLGLNCPVYCTKATADLVKILLPDSGRLQEEEAEWRSRKPKRSRHHPPLPLYTEEDAKSALGLVHPVAFESSREVLEGVKVTWRPMGHILGAASITLEAEGRKITFSGDIGRYDVPILCDPAPVDFGDLLLIESTYGDRLHGSDAPQAKLARIISETTRRRGVVVIPSFAVGRTQLLLYYIRELKEQGKIPDIPVVIDSPMATDATAVYKSNPGCYDEEALGILKRGKQPFLPNKLGFTRDRRDSIKLNSIDEPMIIISASGMLTGGRILHHLRHRVSSPLNTVVFVGYQPPGSRGDWMKSGAETMKLFGAEVPIRCQVEEVSGLSAHGDREELLSWCRQCTGTPAQVMVVHGEPESAQSFSKALHEQFGWNARPAKYLEEIEV